LERRTGTALRQPLRVVFDRRARLPLESQLLRTLDWAPVLVVASQEADATRLAALRDAGAETLVADGIEAALAELGRRQITSLFLEGGRTLADAFVDAGAIDQAQTFLAPILLGGAQRAGPVAGDGPPAHPPEDQRPAPPARATALASEVETVGDDVLITARFKEW
jgi:diaminohydroxyphosphoribosylaminopyrimidine deaminase/5-amino-6-(5-phosphoribosylamino)uracil reductase